MNSSGKLSIFGIGVPTLVIGVISPDLLSLIVISLEPLELDVVDPPELFLDIASGASTSPLGNILILWCSLSLLGLLPGSILLLLKK